MEIIPQVSVQDWLSIPHDIRARLKEIFNIKQSQGVILENNIVKSDGFTHTDLQAITVEKMQKYLESDEESFFLLFKQVIDRLDDEYKLIVPEEDEIDPKQLIVDEWVAVFNRIKGQSVENSMEDYLVNVIFQVFDLKPLTPLQDVSKRRSPKKVKQKSKKS